MVVKRDGTRQPFSRQKLLNGIMLALRKRPVGRMEVEELVDCIEAKLAEQYRLEVPSRELGEIVMGELMHLDPVAYVRFASVYRQFDNPEQFVAELGNIRKGGDCVQPRRQDTDRRIDRHARI